MLSSRNLSQGFAKYLAPKRITVACVRPAAPAIADADKDEPVAANNLKGSFGPALANVVTPRLNFFKQQQRFSHTDISVPDFNDYRREISKNASVPAGETDVSRRAFTYVMVAGLGVTGAHAGKNMLVDFLSTMSASADVLAVSKVEVDLAAIPPGKNVTIKWRGKPLFVRHRTQQEIDEVRAVDTGSLRDPEADELRVKHPNYLVLLGVCTHLGCVPIANAGDFGGYYCPCHGSHYDASGRIRKGPAPLNLEIPYYEFPTETSLVVG